MSRKSKISFCDVDEVIMTFKEELIMAENRGKKEGIGIGIEEGKRHIALNMLEMGLDIDMIAEVTGLSLEEIQKLKKA